MSIAMDGLLNAPLVEGWTVVRIADVVETAQGGFASGEKSVNNGLKHLRMNNIGEEGELVLDVLRTVPPGLARNHHGLISDDVLVCTTNSGKLVGKCALFRLEGEFAFSNHITRLRPFRSLIDASYLRWWLWNTWRSGTYQPLCQHWVSRHADGTICFAITVVCKDCKHVNTIVDTDHRFLDANWWEELGRWHRNSLELLGPYERDRSEPGFPRLVVGPPPLRSYHVYGGYRGDVGPILLWIQASDLLPGMHNNGFGSVKLERGSQIRPLPPAESAENLSWSRWYELPKYPDGCRFQHAGQEWIKLSRAEIVDILRDRVFTVASEEVVSPVAEQRPKRGTSRKPPPPMASGPCRKRRSAGG